MSRIVKDVAEKIRTLEIQGATTIALKGLEAFHLSLVEEGEWESVSENVEFLKSARPNEPMLYNLLDVYVSLIGESRTEERAREVYENILKKLKEDTERIWTHVANRVKDGMVVVTHCHSSSVVRGLILAKEMGKDFVVYNTETRPRYQGRKTARELAEAGVKVVHGVDACARIFLQKADLFLFGADVILPDGSVLNKIGTAMFALISFFYDVESYSVTHTLKFYPPSKWGEYPDVEVRDREEVWDYEKVEIFNPAFEKVPAKYFTGFITEKGIVKEVSFLKWEV